MRLRAWRNFVLHNHASECSVTTWAEAAWLFRDTLSFQWYNRPVLSDLTRETVSAMYALK